MTSTSSTCRHSFDHFDLNNCPAVALRNLVLYYFLLEAKIEHTHVSQRETSSTRIEGSKQKKKKGFGPWTEKEPYSHLSAGSEQLDGSEDGLRQKGLSRNKSPAGEKLARFPYHRETGCPIQSHPPIAPEGERKPVSSCTPAQDFLCCHAVPCPRSNVFCLLKLSPCHPSCSLLPLFPSIRLHSLTPSVFNTN